MRGVCLAFYGVAPHTGYYLNTTPTHPINLLYFALSTRERYHCWVRHFVARLVFETDKDTWDPMS